MDHVKVYLCRHDRAIAGHAHMRYHDVMSAEAFIPKIGVTHDRRALYEKAHAAARARLPGLQLSEWCRRALDAAAREELNLKGCPSCQASIPGSRRRKPATSAA